MRSALSSLSVVLFTAGLLLGGLACTEDGDSTRTAETRMNTEARTGTSYKTDPQPAPDTTVHTLNGAQVSLSGAEDRLLLINFWATWCAPCRKEIPDLIELQETFGSDALTVVGVSLDKKGVERVRSFVEEQKINYPIVHDPNGEVESKFGSIYGLPTTYVVNPNGQIVRRIVGIFPTEEMRPELESILNASGSGSA